jgi:hypothetical protein
MTSQFAMKIKIALCAILLTVASFATAQTSSPAAADPAHTSQSVPQNSQKPAIRLIWLSNVHKEEPHEQGHGRGDMLFVLIRGSVAAGGLSELEGSQQDPPSTCMTGQLQHGVLTLENDQNSKLEKPIKVVGALARTPHGYVLRGRVEGSIYESPSGVVLRQVFGDQTSDDVEQMLTDQECICEWDRALAEKSFVAERCKSSTQSGDKSTAHEQ